MADECLREEQLAQVVLTDQGVQTEEASTGYAAKEPGEDGLVEPRVVQLAEIFAHEPLWMSRKRELERLWRQEARNYELNGQRKVTSEEFVCNLGPGLAAEHHAEVDEPGPAEQYHACVTCSRTPGGSR